MTREALIQEIKKKAKQDAKNRRDPRFIETMGFLVAKGFLRTNLDIPLLPNKRLKLDGAMWAGQNVEPRILEVLPAAVLRLGKHFDLDPLIHMDLARVVDQLRKGEEMGEDFCEIPYEKMKVWADFQLRDKRVKPSSKKKVVKTFRLDPMAIECLKKAAKKKCCSETEIVEALLMRPAIST
ncbi:hypothetical protein WDW37_13225 [Bdellovibrionota bacterium FG-1]